MLRRLGTLLACLAMFSIAGGHWAVLQSVAWAGMLQDYSRADGFAAAVEKTFSGDYPCALCRKIDEQKKKETPALAKLEQKSEPFLAPRPAAALFPPPPTYFLSLPAALRPSSVAFAPPQPIPRRA